MDGITSMLKILDIILDTLHAKKRNLKQKKLNNPNDTVKTAKKYGSSGSFTVESAFIVPVLLFIMYLTIWGMFFMYQKVVLEKTAYKAARQGAFLWSRSIAVRPDGSLYLPEKQESLFHSNQNKDFSFSETISRTENLQNKKDEMLKKLRESSSIQEKRVSAVRYAIYEELDKGILRYENIDLAINYENSILKEEVLITIKQKINVPFIPFLRFSDEGVISISSAKKAVVTDTGQFIRNMDLGMEYIKKLGNKFDIKSLFGK